MICIIRGNKTKQIETNTLTWFTPNKKFSIVEYQLIKMIELFGSDQKSQIKPNEYSDFLNFLFNLIYLFTFIDISGSD